MTRREWLLSLLWAPTLWPAALGGWVVETFRETALANGQMEMRLLARHSVTGDVLENAVRIQPADGGSLAAEERARARALGRAMLLDWFHERTRHG